MIVTTEQKPDQEEQKDWENPLNPEAPKDARDKEQAQRLFEEAKRLKENLTETDKPE